MIITDITISHRPGFLIFKPEETATILKTTLHRLYLLPLYGEYHGCRLRAQSNQVPILEDAN